MKKLLALIVTAILLAAATLTIAAAPATAAGCREESGVTDRTFCSDLAPTGGTVDWVPLGLGVAAGLVVVGAYILTIHLIEKRRRAHR